MQAVMFPFPSAFVDMRRLALPETTCCENTIYTDYTDWKKEWDTGWWIEIELKLERQTDWE